jgi:hypothetical protein
MPTTLLKSINLLAVLTAVFGALPFAIYFIEQRLGSITTSEVWYATGANHGPWRGGFEVATIYDPVVLLLFMTVCTRIYKGIKTNNGGLVASGMLLVVVQLALLLAQMYFLTWTID